MRTVPFSQVLTAASLLWSGLPNPTLEDGAILQTRIALRAEEMWQAFYWPEWTQTDSAPRTFRPAWNAGTAYNNPDTVYWPWTRAYYQALQANTNQPPLIQAGGSWVLNAAYWALAQGDYCGLSVYQNGVAYASGTQVFWPGTQQPFQCIAACQNIDPTNAACWALLVEFERSLSLTASGAVTMDAVRNVWDRNPDIHNEAAKIPFAVRNGFIVCRGTEPVVWPEYRLLPPAWNGNAYNAKTAYGAGVTVYYTASNATSDFFTTVSATTAGDTPESAPAKFSLIPFPFVLWKPVAQSAFADMLRVDGQQEKYQSELAEAARLLREEFDKLERQQGQTRPLNVQNSWNANPFNG